MAIAPTIFPRHLTELHVAALTGETVGSLVRLKGIRELELSIATEATELRGDGTVISTGDLGQTLEWSAESGGLTMDALEVMFGINAVDTGTTPSVVRTLTFKSTDPRPYFYIVGKALHDDGVQDVHVQIFKAKVTGNLDLTFSDGEYVTPSFEGTAIGRASDDVLLKIVQHETAIAPAAPA